MARVNLEPGKSISQREKMYKTQKSKLGKEHEPTASCDEVWRESSYGICIELTLPSAKESYIRLAGKDSFGAEQDSARGMGAVLPDGVITRPFRRAKITNRC